MMGGAETQMKPLQEKEKPQVEVDWWQQMQSLTKLQAWLFGNLHPWDARG